ncbi:MAG: molybdate ABC transporter substrate-binding protein [Bacteroidota bacterium]
MLTFTSCKKATPESLTIATAANMQFVMTELVETFKSTYGIKVQLVMGSSGLLSAQIQNKAPYDAFVAANMKYPMHLHSLNLTLDTPSIYAYGQLVLWSKSGDVPERLNQLQMATYQHIALANPELAPYGMAAREALENSGLYQQLEDRLVYGESIAQVNQFIFSEAAQIGFTAKSVVLSNRLKAIGQWIDVPKQLYTPISQGIVLLKNRPDFQQEAALFRKFLFSDKGKEILNKYGYQQRADAAEDVSPKMND